MPTWLDVEAVAALHDVALYPGDERGRNPGSDLEGAINRPRQWYHYEGVRSLPKLAALYGVSITKAHAFRDGNKRTALLAVDAFLDQNGVRFSIDDATAEAVPVFEAVATGEIEHTELAAWIETHVDRPAFKSKLVAYWRALRTLLPQ